MTESSRMPRTLKRQAPEAPARQAQTQLRTQLRKKPDRRAGPDQPSHSRRVGSRKGFFCGRRLKPSVRGFYARRGVFGRRPHATSSDSTMAIRNPSTSTDQHHPQTTTASTPPRLICPIDGTFLADHRRDGITVTCPRCDHRHRIDEVMQHV